MEKKKREKFFGPVRLKLFYFWCTAPRRGATRLAPGEERSDVTWGLTEWRFNQTCRPRRGRTLAGCWFYRFALFEAGIQVICTIPTTMFALFEGI